MRGSDLKDSYSAQRVLLGIAVLLAIVVIAGVLMLPALGEFLDVYMAPGLGLKDAAVVSFFVTLVLLVVMAFAAGDGLIGEIQFMIAAFLAFFLVFWLLIAWIF